MKKTQKFKLEVVIDVEYDVPEGMATSPYTKMGCTVNKENHLEIITTEGTIKDGTLISLKRVNE